MISVYLSSSTWLHRIPAGIKLSSLAVISVLTLYLEGWLPSLVALIIVLLGYVSLGPEGLHRLRILKGFVVLLLGLGTFQALISGWEGGVALVLKTLFIILLADLVSMTTTMQEMIRIFKDLFFPFRSQAERISLAIALMIRLVPVSIQTWQSLQDAYQSRVAKKGSFVLIPVFLSQMLKLSDRVSESLKARQYRS